jgi:hypothetical protein
MRPLFPTVSHLRNASCARRGFSFFTLCALLAQGAKFSPLCFQPLAHPFSLFARERHAISLLFNRFHTLCKSTGRPGPLPHPNTPTSQPRLGQRCVLQHRPGKRTGSGRCSLFAMSLFRHIVTSSLHPEKPYPTPYHLMAKRYRTHPCNVGVYSGFRVCFRCPGLKWSPGLRVCLTNPELE